jgi:hypothetical protein
LCLTARAANCWSCGKKPIGRTLHQLGLLWVEVQDYLAGLGGFSAGSEGPAARPPGRLKLPDGLGPLRPVHEAYLRGRGFDPDELVKLWGVQGIGLAVKYAWRIFLPITHKAKTVSWSTRRLTDAEPRYGNAPREDEAVPAKTLLYGEDYCRHAVVVTEGFFDAVRVGPGAVATMGLSYTRQQLERIARYPVRAVCFDSERAAQRRARKLCSDLEVFPGRTMCIELDAADPGSASLREVQRLRKAVLE